MGGELTHSHPFQVNVFLGDKGIGDLFGKIKKSVEINLLIDVIITRLGDIWVNPSGSLMDEPLSIFQVPELDTYKEEFKFFGNQIQDSSLPITVGIIKSIGSLID